MVLFVVGCQQRDWHGYTIPELGAIPLFSGTTLDGFDTYLGPPSPELVPIGLNYDPQHVFSIVSEDGQPAIRISGQTWGALITKQEYQRFHLMFQYKWGHQVWPPLNFRDSGVMYHSTGKFGMVNAGGNSLAHPAESGSFMVSLEYQIATGDVATLYNLGPISMIRTPYSRARENDGWNFGEIRVEANSSTHFLNGTKVMAAKDFVLGMPGTKPIPLTGGKLQFQSEGAEIFFRDIKIVPLAATYAR